jgi:hypothetical protein
MYDISWLKAFWYVTQNHANPLNRFLDLPSIVAQPNLIWDSEFVDNQVVEPLKHFMKQLKIFDFVKSY